MHATHRFLQVIQNENWKANNFLGTVSSQPESWEKAGEISQVCFLIRAWNKWTESTRDHNYILIPFLLILRNRRNIWILCQLPLSPAIHRDTSTLEPEGKQSWNWRRAGGVSLTTPQNCLGAVWGDAHSPSCPTPAGTARSVMIPAHPVAIWVEGFARTLNVGEAEPRWSPGARAALYVWNHGKAASLWWGLKNRLVKLDLR